LNKGSTFRIVIPDIAFIRDFEKKDRELYIDPGSIIFDEATVIIADDVEHNRKLLVDTLRYTNLKIIEAENGEQAYNLVKETTPDLIIADIRMPVMDGFELLKKLKKDKKLKHIPIIAYSASVMKSQKEKILKSEFKGLLDKPLQINELYLELMNSLPHHKIEKDITTEREPAEEIKASEIKKLSGLIKVLDTELNEIWKTFSRRQPMNEVRSFGERLIRLGKKHKANILADYGKELIDATNSFDVKAIQRLLRKYPELLDRFREI
jgi:polar amino acid transport system substrate-binding protein/two-component system sensor histidine kinase EvgS